MGCLPHAAAPCLAALSERGGMPPAPPHSSPRHRVRAQGPNLSSGGQVSDGYANARRAADRPSTLHILVCFDLRECVFGASGRQDAGLHAVGAANRVVVLLDVPDACVYKHSSRLIMRPACMQL